MSRKSARFGCGRFGVGLENQKGGANVGYITGGMMGRTFNASLTTQGTAVTGAKTVIGNVNNLAGKRVAGVITKIDGTTITVTDNGGKTAVITSGSDTVIMTSTGEVGLAALRAGRFISALVGGTDNSNLASVINIAVQ